MKTAGLFVSATHIPSGTTANPRRMLLFPQNCWVPLSNFLSLSLSSLSFSLLRVGRCSRIARRLSETEKKAQNKSSLHHDTGYRKGMSYEELIFNRSSSNMRRQRFHLRVAYLKKTKRHVAGARRPPSLQKKRKKKKTSARLRKSRFCYILCRFS